MIKIALAIAVLSSVGLPAISQVSVPAVNIEPTLAQCLDAVAEGKFLGFHDTTGERVFFFSGATYFVFLYPEYVECRAVRYVPAD